MTLSDRIAAATGPDRSRDIQLEAEIVVATSYVVNGHLWISNGSICAPMVLFCPIGCKEDITNKLHNGGEIPPYLRSIDAAISTVQPAMQEHIMREALTLVGQRGFIVGKFTEQLARAICEVSMRERGL